MAAGVTIAAQWPWLNLADDVRFTFGALRTAEVARPALEVFAHRPMANRVLMSGLDQLSFGPVALREKLIMSFGVIIAGFAVAVLHRALRTRTDAVLATVVALAVFLSLAWASEPYVLQPEWSATVLGVLALGLIMLQTSSVIIGRVLLALGCLVLAVAVLQKYSTVTVAGLVIIVVWLVDRRRAVLLALFGAATTVILLGLTFVLGSREWQWFLETPKLNPAVGLRRQAFAEWTVNVGFNNPILLAWPAAAALAAALTGRRRWVVACVVGFGGVMAVIIAQNQFFSYHGTPLLPVAAAVVAYAGALWLRRFGTLPWGIVPLGLWLIACMVILRLPAQVRSESRDAVGFALLVVVLAVAVLSRVQLARSTASSLPDGSSFSEPFDKLGTGSVEGQHHSILAMIAAVIMALVLTFPAWPATPYGLFGLDRSRRSEIVRQSDLQVEADGVRAIVGDAPVAYLADGETVYFIDAKTPCAYPPAVVLYRSQDPAVGGLRSFSENLDCLTAPSVRYLVWQLWRVPLDEVDPRIGEVVNRTYDCGEPARMVEEILICPRLGAG